MYGVLMKILSDLDVNLLIEEMIIELIVSILKNKKKKNQKD